MMMAGRNENKKETKREEERRKKRRKRKEEEGRSRRIGRFRLFILTTFLCGGNPRVVKRNAHSTPTERAPFISTAMLLLDVGTRV
jgi:hypothetical protein